VAFWGAREWSGEINWSRRYNSNKRRRRIVTEAKAADPALA
jgi:hypothetical protein